ncbi:CHAT domain-containing protein [Colwellia sp. 4_MG-2023]|uniref:CHAT domain-containing protein n=1 Tax=unclassified Colwellia TaxID=196834 RepID=UPI0026E33EBE|nr:MULTISPECIES: CHAT domain-containing protein [unclassified Colwellia]MDO6505543.1 CHAT domain-containing protein [Colwellia sp. 5_MG-2023]MDO6554161.1 CHAT domain-containing protein [Colwellia sp. 4_MG-2023]
MMENIKLARYLEEQYKVKYRKIKPRYIELNTRAIELSNTVVNVKQLIDAERLFKKALKLTDKNLYMKASAHHELGVFYFTHFARLPGGPNKNLKLAEQYFNLAINSSERKRYPDQYASSLSQLAATYRRAAMERLWHQTPDECIEQAEKLHKKALKVLSNSLPDFIRLHQSAIVNFNLASVLFDAGRIIDACNEQAEAFECYIAAIKAAPDASFISKINLKPSQILPLTFARLNYFSDKLEHKALCEKILDISPQFGVELSILLSTNPISDIANPLVEIQHLVRQALKTNSFEVVKLLKERLSQLMEIRRHSSTDQEADSVGVLIQQACSGLARVLSNNNEELKAFTELENVSAMRFCESAMNHWIIPEKKLAIGLKQAQGRLGSSYYSLNELALLLKGGQLDIIKQHLKDCAIILSSQNEVEFDHANSQIFNDKKYREVIEAASINNKPVELLSNVAEVCLKDFNKVGSFIDNLDPGYYGQHRETYFIKERDIKVALGSHPELTLVKIDIEDHYNDALILVAYHENNKVRVNSFSIELPKQIINKIAEMITKGKSATEHWELDFIDWKNILPKGCKNVGLLPSFFASHIPWVATGHTGYRLVDLVKEVNWLPSIMYLYMESKYFQYKSGTYMAQGGATLFDNLAHNAQLTNENNYSKSDVLNQVNDAKVFSYYGHCEHRYPERPTLLFQNSTIKDIDLSSAVRGATRVELWACQSGSNIPLHILPSNVNEAFGMDMRMLEWGAKTSIGTLWAVPELVTAHIKKHYDLLLAEGNSASVALLSSQRWWVSKGADDVLNDIKTNGKTNYLKSINYNSVNYDSLDAPLGPVLSSNDNVNTLDLDALRESFKHPSSWAGIRFCGVSTAKSTFIDPEKVKLTENDKIKLNQLINKMNLESGFIV